MMSSERSRVHWERKMNLLARTILTSLLKQPRTSVEVFLRSDVELRQLERRYMHKEKKVVDVLSFPHPEGFPHPDRPGRFLGEVYLNWELFPKDFSKLSFLLIHGILHLLGYDHKRKGDIIEMETLEQTLWQNVLSSV